MEKNVSVRVEIDPSADGTEVIIKTEERSALPGLFPFAHLHLIYLQSLHNLLK